MINPQEGSGNTPPTFMQVWLKDPKDGAPSVTLTAFVLGFSIACLKLLASGIVVGGLSLSPFSGGEFAAVVASVGSLYWARRNAGNPTPPGKEEG